MEKKWNVQFSCLKEEKKEVYVFLKYKMWSFAWQTYFYPHTSDELVGKKITYTQLNEKKKFQSC